MVCKYLIDTVCRAVVFLAYTSRYSHQVHGGGARWVRLDQQLGGDLPTRLNLGLNHLHSERQRDGLNMGEEQGGHTPLRDITV